MAVEEINAETITFPTLARRALRGTGILPLREDPVYNKTAATLDDDFPVLSSGAFVEELDSLTQSVEREETMEALVALDQGEVRALIRKAAKAKGRYLAALVDASDRDLQSDQTILRLGRLRNRQEELSRGVALVKSLILSGEILIQGVSR